MESQMQKQYFCVLLLLEPMETVRRLFKSYYTSFSGVSRVKDSKCINKNKIKIQFLYFMTLATNHLKGREQEQKKMIFQLRIEIAILGYGKANGNLSGKHSRITHNIQYLCAHKHPCEVQVTIALQAKDKTFPHRMALFPWLRVHQMAPMNS